MNGEIAGARFGVPVLNGSSHVFTFEQKRLMTTQKVSEVHKEEGTTHTDNLRY